MTGDRPDSLATRPSVQRPWSPAMKLSDWRQCAAGPGLYAIGVPAGKAIGPPVDNQGLLGGLPDNFEVVYVGKSLERRLGVRGRLAKHFRGGRGGNRCIGMHVRAGIEFWYCVLEGNQAAALETMYLYFVPKLQPRFNFRGELFRHMREQYAALGDYIPPAGGLDPADQIAAAGSTSIDGVNRLRWTSPNCEFDRPPSSSAKP